MNLSVREMKASEVALIADYFLTSTPEHLDLMGVDPSRLPNRREWIERMESLLQLPVEKRSNFLVVWLRDERPVGFSTADKIVFAERANMHLHVTEEGLRGRGVGVECVRQSVEIYFERLHIKSLYCEPNAFNVRPNRTLQAAGFKYLKTYMTVPGPLNFRQAVTRWSIER